MSRPGAFAGGFALAAVVLYVGATGLGGTLDAGYSQVSMHVSELTSSHAPDRTLLAVLYSAHNVAIAGAGLALLRAVTWSRWLAAVAWLLVAVARPASCWSRGSRRTPTGSRQRPRGRRTSPWRAPRRC